jgi:hypothetical protein
LHYSSLHKDAAIYFMDSHHIDQLLFDLYLLYSAVLFLKKKHTEVRVVYFKTVKFYLKVAGNMGLILLFLEQYNG